MTDNGFSKWASESLVFNPDASITAASAYADYRGKCAKIGVKPASSLRFAMLMKLLVNESDKVATTKVRGEVTYLGLSIQ